MSCRFTRSAGNDPDECDFIIELGRLGKKRKATCAAMRPLRGDEIRALEALGNRAEEWGALRVSANFVPDNICNNRFLGACFLGSFRGVKVDTGNSMKIPSGIVDSVIMDSVIADECCIWNVKGLGNYFVDEGAVLFNTGIVSCSSSAVFGNGREIAIGIETGGREILSFADMTIETAWEIATCRDAMGSYRNFMKKYLEKARVGYGVAAAGCRIRNCQRITNSFLGESCVCDNVTLIENSTILCSADEAAGISDGAFVRNSCLQWGCHVGSMAIVDDSVMTEHSHAERHGKITSSIIGPNTGIAEGEVTACIVGPFVGFHHQALLIGALWPQGKGNVAYGANVGSNHTSKAPDQEIYCGEGMFFGLGTSIKFPADYSRAPYSIVATGVTTLPQRVEFPFSLINSPSGRFEGLSPAYNELVPAWVLSDNLYAVARNEGKYLKRNMARRLTFSPEVFRPEIIDLMVQARERLRSVTEVREFYTDAHIPGTGKNFITGKNLVRAVETYSRHIERYCLTGLFLQCKQSIAEHNPVNYSVLAQTASNDTRWEHERSLCVAEGIFKRTLRENLARLSELMDDMTAAIVAAKEKDDKRGQKIMSDYMKVHTPAKDDTFVKESVAKHQAFRKELDGILPLLPSV